MSLFRAIKPEKMKVFDNIVSERIALKPGEQVLIVGDVETEPEMIGAFIDAINKAGGVFTVAIQPNAGWKEDDLYALTRSMERAYVGADVVIAATKASQSSVYGRPDEYRATMKKGGKSRMFCVAERTFEVVASDTADYKEVLKTSTRIKEKIMAGKKVRATSEAGSDLVADIPKIEYSHPWTYMFSHDGFARFPGEFGCSPDGEVHFPPIYTTVNGIIVVDGPIANVCISPPDKPVRIDVEKGRIVSIEGGDDAERLRKLIEQHKADYISEIGLGTNPEWKRNIFSAKSLGNLHIAYGGWWGVQDTNSIIAARGKDRADEAIPCNIHGDMVLFKGTLEIDGQVIIDGSSPKPLP
jgi:leucyl aminopeptidase (aminopeptidase T)